MFAVSYQKCWNSHFALTLREVIDCIRVQSHSRRKLISAQRQNAKNVHNHWKRHDISLLFYSICLGRARSEDLLLCLLFYYAFLEQLCTLLHYPDVCRQKEQFHWNYFSHGLIVDNAFMFFSLPLSFSGAWSIFA